MRVYYATSSGPTRASIFWAGARTNVVYRLLSVLMWSIGLSRGMISTLYAAHMSVFRMDMSSSLRDSS